MSFGTGSSQQCWNGIQCYVEKTKFCGNEQTTKLKAIGLLQSTAPTSELNAAMTTIVMKSLQTILTKSSSATNEFI